MVEEPVNSVNNDAEDECVTLFHKILGSCNINFLFGAGVNGGAFPSFALFTKTIDKTKEFGLSGDGIEEALRSCDDSEVRQAILDTFVNEFNEQDYTLDHPSLVNLNRLLVATHKAVNTAENRHPESKRINIFTLNYDRIVEEKLEANGFFSYVLKSETASFLPFNVVGYNTETRAFVPTFAVYKLHGTVGADRKLKGEEIVFPGQDKLGSVISNFYETLFAMKGELLRKNAALFVIGYSWADEHVNDIVDCAINNGLTVVFPQYDEKSLVPDGLADKVIIIPPAETNEDDKPCDTAKTLAKLFEKAMR